MGNKNARTRKEEAVSAMHAFDNTAGLFSDV